jgi:hypothetical protein
VRAALGELERYRTLSPAAKKEDLWQWYGLSRVNELLVGGLAQALPHQKEYLQRDLHRRDALFQHESLVHGRLPTVGLAEYREFFEELGFTVFGAGAFTPFRHEIVEVGEGDHCFWPGLMFGEMLFARAGVRAHGDFDPELAARSPLYFTWWRPHRETEDLSHGWGASSQWHTEFRRDYQSGGQLHYNVDGRWQVGESTQDSDLTVEERVELLTHRCFVRCRKRPWGRWPYGDRFTCSATTTV